MLAVDVFGELVGIKWEQDTALGMPGCCAVIRVECCALPDLLASNL
jgi:hypothetical protein